MGCGVSSAAGDGAPVDKKLLLSNVKPADRQEVPRSLSPPSTVPADGSSLEKFSSRVALKKVDKQGVALKDTVDYAGITVSASAMMKQRVDPVCKWLDLVLKANTTNSWGNPDTDFVLESDALSDVGFRDERDEQ